MSKADEIISKEEIKNLLKDIKKYFKVVQKHLNNMYALDENQYQLIDEYIEQLETEKENTIEILEKELKANRAKTDCRFCNNTCDSYQTCKALKKILKIMKGENDEEKYNINEKVKTIYDETGIIKDISFNENTGKTVYLIYFENSTYNTYKWYAKDEINKMKEED